MVNQTTSRKRELRHNSTAAEQIFWSKVCAKQFRGYKFRRQHDIGVYIVDFYCPKLKLIIEIDGDSHFSKSGVSSDKKRTAYLTSKGYKIVRYNNLEVVENIDGVFQDLAVKIDAFSPSPNLSLEGRGINQNHNQ